MKKIIEGVWVESERRGRGGRTGTSCIDGGEVDITSANGSHVGTSNIDGEIWEHGVAGESDTADASVVDGAVDLAVVGVDDSGVGEH